MLYREPTFTARLREIQALPGSGVSVGAAGTVGVRVGPATDPSFNRQLGALVLSVQAPLLQKYGLPPDASGVVRMKFAIQRRTVEESAQGVFRLHDLANEARYILGLLALRDMRTYSNAEDLCASQAAGNTLDEAGSNGGVEEETVRKLLARAQEAGRVSRASVQFIEERMDPLSRHAVTPLVARTLVGLAETGLPLSSLSGADVARDPELLGPIAVLERIPRAADFFQRFVLPGRPAVFRDLLGEWPLLKELADFGYLRRRCGHRRVLVKTLALNDREGRRVFVSDPELKLYVAQDLNRLHNAGTRSTGLRRLLAVRYSTVCITTAPMTYRVLDCAGCVCVLECAAREHLLCWHPWRAHESRVRPSRPFLDFLAMVETCERDGSTCPFYLGKVPLRTELPELNEDLERSPPPVVASLAECFGPLLPQGVFTYFGCSRQVTCRPPSLSERTQRTRTHGDAASSLEHPIPPRRRFPRCISTRTRTCLSASRGPSACGSTRPPMPHTCIPYRLPTARAQRHRPSKPMRTYRSNSERSLQICCAPEGHWRLTSRRAMPSTCRSAGGIASKARWSAT